MFIDAKPTCSYKVEDGSLRANCSIGFSGFWSPKLEWSSTSGKLDPTDTQTTPHSRVTSSIFVPFRQHDSTILTCTSKFSLEDMPLEGLEPATMAKNIPEFRRSCTVPDTSTG